MICCAKLKEKTVVYIVIAEDDRNIRYDCFYLNNKRNMGVPLGNRAFFVMLIFSNSIWVKNRIAL